MNNSIINQVDIDVAELLEFSKSDSTPAKPVALEAELKETLPAAPKNASKTALLQVSVAGHAASELTAALKLLEKEFTSINIYLDLELALLAYSILLPYMPEDEVQDIVANKKQEWVTQNLKFISKVTIPWSIITDGEQRIQQAKDSNILKLNELFEHDSDFNKKIKADAVVLKNYLFETHGITNAIYNQATDKNDSALERYLIARIAAVAAMHSFSNNDYTYVTPIKMSSYNHLQKIAALQHMPSCSILHFKKMIGDKEPLTSTELNQNLHEFDLLGKISSQKSYLEESVKHFPGNAYIESLGGILVNCNDQQALACGLANRSYVEGKSVKSFHNKNDAQEILDTVDKITTTGETQLLIEDHVYGEKTLFLSIKMPLRNKKNIPIGIIGFSLKIEDEAEIQKIRNSDHVSDPADLIQNFAADSGAPDNNHHIKNLVEQMPGYVYWQDTNGKILGCNQNQAEFLGFDSPKDMIGKYPNSFLTASHAKEALAELEEIAKTGEPIIKEEVYKSTDKIMVMRSHKTAIKDNSGKVKGVMVIALDTSKNKQQLIKLEKEREKLELANNFKNHFIRDIEQDMRAPFISLCSMTELCASRETDTSKKRQLLEISNCAKDLLAYCDSLLEFSRNESFQNNNNLIPLKDLVDSVVNTSITALRAKRLEFDLDYDRSIPRTIIGDSYRLRRILSNLMSNAIKYTDEGYIKLIIKLDSYKNDKIEVSFMIIDSGIGISKEEQQHIFNKYTMLNHKNRGSETGQGLGLNEIKRFVEDLHGKIFIDSDTGKGTSITVKLNFEVEPAT